MKASELRIGNYVKTNHDFVIKSYSAEGLYNIVKRIDEYKPIPLTEEWLLKFGLKQSNTDKKRFYILGTDIYIFNESKIFFNAGSSNLSIQLYYVHQLQNLYFALTNEELTYEQQK